METVTFKLQEEIIEKMDSFLKPLHFSNRTEFIREAIREKLNKIEKDPVIEALEKFKGSANAHVSDKRLHEIGEEIFRKYAEKFGVKSD